MVGVFIKKHTLEVMMKIKGLVYSKEGSFKLLLDNGKVLDDMISSTSMETSHLREISLSNFSSLRVFPTEKPRLTITLEIVDPVFYQEEKEQCLICGALFEENGGKPIDNDVYYCRDCALSGKVT